MEERSKVSKIPSGPEFWDSHLSLLLRLSPMHSLSTARQVWKLHTVHTFIFLLHLYPIFSGTHLILTMTLWGGIRLEKSWLVAGHPVCLHGRVGICKRFLPKPSLNTLNYHTTLNLLPGLSLGKLTSVLLKFGAETADAPWWMHYFGYICKQCLILFLKDWMPAWSNEDQTDNSISVRTDDEYSYWKLCEGGGTLQRTKQQGLKHISVAVPKYKTPSGPFPASHQIRDFFYANHCSFIIVVAAVINDI